MLYRSLAIHSISIRSYHLFHLPKWRKKYIWCHHYPVRNNLVWMCVYLGVYNKVCGRDFCHGRHGYKTAAASQNTAPCWWATPLIVCVVQRWSDIYGHDDLSAPWSIKYTKGEHWYYSKYGCHTASALWGKNETVAQIPIIIYIYL